ncbi:MAG: hypothetical protein KFW21_03370 [Spirochaetota bacterium]|nr:hypothetical protein [Spirochaetota bacterium]
MLLKIFSQQFTLYIFTSGYFFTFLIMIIQKFPILNTFWIAFIGGVSFCGIWGFCIKLLTILFSESELSDLFRIPLPPGKVDVFNEYDDDDALTLNDLYNSPEDSDSSFSSPYITNNVATDDENSSNSLIDLEDNIDIHESTPPTVSTNGKLDANGNFNLTVNGKTLKASPEDGAKAIKKVLHDSPND